MAEEQMMCAKEESPGTASGAIRMRVQMEWKGRMCFQNSYMEINSNFTEGATWVGGRWLGGWCCLLAIAPWEREGPLHAKDNFIMKRGWWYMPITPAFGRLRQEDGEF